MIKKCPLRALLFCGEGLLVIKNVSELLISGVCSNERKSNVYLAEERWKCFDYTVVPQLGGF